MIRRAADFASGRRQEHRQRLQQQMRQAADAMQFELAATVKSRLDRLSDFDVPKYAHGARPAGVRLRDRPAGAVVASGQCVRLRPRRLGRGRPAGLPAGGRPVGRRVGRGEQSSGGPRGDHPRRPPAHGAGDGVSVLRQGQERPDPAIRRPGVPEALRAAIEASADLLGLKAPIKRKGRPKGQRQDQGAGTEDQGGGTKEHEAGPATA